MTDMTAGDLLKAGKLSEALTAAQNAVRKAPTDLSARILLAEILVFTGNLERADVLLDAASTIDPSTAMVVAEFRQLIRADMARRQLFRDGRVPELRVMITAGHPPRLRPGPTLKDWISVQSTDRRRVQFHQ